LRGLVEALLFTSQKPVDLKDLARSAGIDKPRARELVEQLQRSYDGRGLCIEEIAGGFVMRSAPRYAPYIQKILALRPVRLSRAQLETLAIVAYRQPVTKPEVDDIRGVDSGQVIKGLLERALLKMLGKKDEPGRPTLYGTTTDFLELLNLQSLKDLPTLREYTELSEESQRKFLDETGEAAPSEPMTFERPPSAELDESADNEAGVYTEVAPEDTSPGHVHPSETDNGPAVDDADDDGAEGADVADEDEGEAITSDQADESSEEDESDDDDADDDDDDESDDDDADDDDDDESDDDDADDDDDDSSNQDEDDDKAK
jgi:segregation and condensation protein B